MSDDTGSSPPEHDSDGAMNDDNPPSNQTDQESLSNPNATLDEAGPPAVLYLGNQAHPSGCDGQLQAAGTGMGADTHWYTFWNFTFDSEATVVRANATIWMDVTEAFVVPTTLGWSFEKEHHNGYRLGGDYWGGDQPVVEPGRYRIEVESDAFGSTSERTLIPGEELRVHWSTTNFGVAASPPFTVLCEPGLSSQMWIEYESDGDAKQLAQPDAALRASQVSS